MFVITNISAQDNAEGHMSVDTTRKIHITPGKYTVISLDEDGELVSPRYFIDWNANGLDMLLRRRYYAKSGQSIPKSLMNTWWEYTDDKLHSGDQSVRHIVHINQYGKIIKFKQYIDKANTLIPECLWINNDPCFVWYGVYKIRGRKLYTITYVARKWLRGIKGNLTDNFVEAYNIVCSSKDKIYLRSIFSSEYVFPEIYKRSFPISKFKRMNSPYSIFPMVPVGEFPDEISRGDYMDECIWEGVTTSINLSSEPLSIEISDILDSLSISIRNLPLLNKEGNIDLELLCSTLKLLDELESKKEKVLLLCSSEGHMLSKLVGECFHYLKSGELINNNFAGFDNVIEYCCKSMLLPELDGFKAFIDSLKSIK